MNVLSLLTTIEAITKNNPSKLAIQGENNALSYQELLLLIKQYSEIFSALKQICFALDIKNGPQWAVLDLALLHANKVNIPIPNFFTDTQIKHLLIDGGVQIVLTDNPNQFKQFSGTIEQIFKLQNRRIYQINLLNPMVKYPQDTVKVTYTSGTTGEPKGVCIDAKSIDKTIHSIIKRSGVGESDCHFSALPLTTLLENIGGLYAALICGASAIIYSQKKIGVSGATGINPEQFISVMNEASATTTILIPEMLSVIVAVVKKKNTYFNSMKFIAVGGAPISKKILKQVQLLNLPVYQGYGLSEATSVVTVNGPHINKIETVGKPLSHIDLKIAEDGEVLIKGSIFKGYLNQDLDFLDTNGYLPTGDIGYLDKDGFLVLQGRKKNIFITSFGRNVAPEWVECELVAQPGVLQAVVFGEGKPFNIAVILTTQKLDIDEAIYKTNKILPDYARVSAWIPAREPFSITNSQLTGTARPKRAEIWKSYQKQIENIYQLKGEIE